MRSHIYSWPCNQSDIQMHSSAFDQYSRIDFDMQIESTSATFKHCRFRWIIRRQIIQLHKHRFDVQHKCFRIQCHLDEEAKRHIDGRWACTRRNTFDEHSHNANHSVQFEWEPDMGLMGQGPVKIWNSFDYWLGDITRCDSRKTTNQSNMRQCINGRRLWRMAQMIRLPLRIQSLKISPVVGYDSGFQHTKWSVARFLYIKLNRFRSLTWNKNENAIDTQHTFIDHLLTIVKQWIEFVAMSPEMPVGEYCWNATEERCQWWESSLDIVPDVGEEIHDGQKTQK